MLKVSIATDEGASGETDTSKTRWTTLVARIAATILKLTVDSNDLSRVTQFPVKEICLNLHLLLFSL